MDFNNLSIPVITAALREKQISAVELTTLLFKRIKRLNALMKSFITLNEAHAMNAARAADDLLAKGAGGPLCGVPYAVKDNICVEGIKTTCASKMLENYLPPFSATAVLRLKASGAICLGKTNMDEFAMGSNGENSAFGAARNPHNLSHVAGGSSGGSAAAVGANFVSFALGSDTGGSVRRPASFCGVTGLKPTYGRVSRHGLVAFSSSLDQIGILAKSSKESAFLLNIIAGKDDFDSTVSNRPLPDYSNPVSKPVIGIADEFFGDFLSDEVKKSVLEAADTFERMGYTLKKVSLPSLKYALSAYYLISSAEAASNLARFDGVRFGESEKGENYAECMENARTAGFGDEVKRRILLGNYALLHENSDDYYKKAMAARDKIRGEYTEIFENCDMLLTPSAPTTAPFAGAESAPCENYKSDICTVSADLAGLPGVSIPCGIGANKLPIGVSLSSAPFCEEKIIPAAAHFEAETEKWRGINTL